MGGVLPWVLAALSIVKARVPYQLSCDNIPEWKGLRELLQKDLEDSFHGEICDPMSGPLAAQAFQTSLSMLRDDVIQQNIIRIDSDGDFFRNCEQDPPPSFSPCIYGVIAAMVCAYRFNMRSEARIFEELLDDGLVPLMRNHQRMFVHLESSTWPVTLKETMRVFEEAAQIGGQRTFDNGLPIADVPVPRAPLQGHFRTWIFGMHGTLASQPASAWQLLQESHMGSLSIDTHVVVPDQRSCGRVTGNAACPPKHILEFFEKNIEVTEGGRRYPRIDDLDSLSIAMRQLFASDEHLRTADVIVCTEPPCFCAFFADWFGSSKVVVGYIANPLGAYVRREQMPAWFNKLAAISREAVFAAASPHNAALIYWHTGVRVPVVRPLGLNTNTIYHPDKDDVLVSKDVMLSWNHVCLFNHFTSDLPWKFVDTTMLNDKSYRSWASFRAVVYLPYDPILITLYEFYAMGVPVLAPHPSIVPDWIAPSFTNDRCFAHTRPGWDKGGLPDFTSSATYDERVFWASTTDIARLPHILHWASIPELIGILASADLREISSNMRRESLRQVLRSSSFWASVLMKIH